MKKQTEFMFKYDCACRKNQWVCRTDRNYNQLKLYCSSCNTELDAIIAVISYSV